QKREVAGRIWEAAPACPRLRTDRRIEVGLSLLHVREKEHRLNPRLQRILRVAFFQRRLTEICETYSGSADAKRAGGAPDSIHECSRDNEVETRREGLHSRSH